MGKPVFGTMNEIIPEKIWARLDLEFSSIIQNAKKI